MVEADYLIHSFANQSIRSRPLRLLYRALTWAHIQLIIAYIMLAVQGPEKFIAVSGSNVSLQSSRRLPGYTHLTWFFTSNQKIVEWDASEFKYFNTTFQDRVKLDPQSTVLHIFNVQKGDSSTYLLRLANENGADTVIKIILEVFDPVPQPVIKIEKTEEVNGNCHMKLLCEGENSSVTYSWYTDSEHLPNKQKESVLDVVLNPRNQSKFYTCQISNPVDSKNDTVYFFPPCTLGKKP
ncbi:CD48 antigen [Ctenodactylus gundi]